ncbi:MAG: dihydrodipicolinate synthase family protein [bacterium]|nr:dihydrodipicolinate synthase family protein [bacterium]
MKSDFSGLIVPVLTPVDEQGRLDEKHYVKLLHRLMARGVDGLFVTGTTGEAAQLADPTWEAANRVALREAAGSRTKVYCGAVFPGTADTIAHIHRLQDMGAEYAFATPTFYNTDGTQEQVLRHYERIVAATQIKLIVYSIAFTTHVDIRPQTLYEISQMDRMIGVKDTRADWPSHLENLKLLKDTKMGIACVIEAMIASSLLSGADGIVTALANFMPEYYVDVLKAARENDVQGVYRAFEGIMNLERAMRCPGGNGVAKMKYLGSLLDVCEPYTSMSTAHVTEEQKQTIQGTCRYILSEMERLGVPAEWR